ncbi:hypothetical protein NDU88_001157 [Pleurodeles waltl]|uniref:Uncharacterized protein n=1 Tax=Pleurodeles waltl TaxID=8319 RepID=A0AAV7P5Y1_PLEWA|nr:hypothetical protein NDU88_001157 [Pleurodeles waltl]
MPNQEERATSEATGREAEGSLQLRKETRQSETEVERPEEDQLGGQENPGRNSTLSWQEGRGSFRYVTTYAAVIGGQQDKGHSSEESLGTNEKACAPEWTLSN